MSPAMTAQRLPDAVVDAAIAWSVRLDYNSPSAEARAAFERWVQADARHALAWERVGAMRGDFAAVPPQLALNTLQAADALRRNGGLGRTGRRGALKALSFAGVALATGWVVREHAPWQRLLADASTAVGEQRTLQLADGTSLALNTDTAVGIELAGAQRRLVLRRGEILVTTGADAGQAAKRPFWVETPFGALQALGTRFTVRLQGERALVAVQEGAVALHPAALGGASVPAAAVLKPGESRWLAAAGTAAAVPTGLQSDAGADGVVAGREMRLADLLAELERYRHGRIVCDERVAGLRVSGVFHVKDTDRALQFIRQTQPVSVVYRTRFWVRVGPEDGA
jgi:transmembrane sensor